MWSVTALSTPRSFAREVAACGDSRVGHAEPCRPRRGVGSRSSRRGFVLVVVGLVRCARSGVRIDAARGVATLRFATREGRLVAACVGWGWPAKRQHFVSCLGAVRDLDHEGGEEERGRDDDSDRDKSDDGDNDDVDERWRHGGRNNDDNDDDNDDARGGGDDGGGEPPCAKKPSDAAKRRRRQISRNSATTATAPTTAAAARRRW